MRVPSSILLTALAAAFLLGCPSKSSDDHKEEDRTLMKLKEAQEKDAKIAPPHAGPGDDEREKLANLAAAGKTDEGGPRPLPSKNETVHVGTVAVKLTGLQTTPMVTSGKLTLSTDQLFLMVKLVAQNVGDKEAQLDFSGATVTSKSGELNLARDAQHVAGTKDLLQKFQPGSTDQQRDLILIFELPPGDLGSGLVLNLGSPTGEKVKLPLE